MTGLAWTAAIWGVAALILFRLSKRHPRLKVYFTRENLALLIALLGTFSVAAKTEAEEVLAEPVVMERVVRGGLSALAIAIAAPVLIARLRMSRSVARPAITALTIYLGIALLSTMYSAAQVVTAAKVFEMVAGVTAVLAVVYGPTAGKRLREMAMMVVLSQVVLLGVAVLGFFALTDTFGVFESRPGFVSDRTLFAPYSHSNALSTSSAIIGVFALAKLLSGRDRRLWLVASGICLVGLVLASGRQGLAMYVLGAAVVLWVMRRRLLAYFLGPAIAIISWSYWDEILEAISRDRPSNWATASGRLYWWEAAISAWSQHPWLGWGYSTGGRFVALESIGRASTSSVHSGYIESLVGVGILGTIPLLYALYRVIRWSIERLRLRVDVALAVLIIPLILRTAVSSGFGGWLNTEVVLFVLLAALSDQDRIDRQMSRTAIRRASPDRVVQAADSHITR